MDREPNENTLIIAALCCAGAIGNVKLAVSAGEGTAWLVLLDPEQDADAASEAEQ